VTQLPSGELTGGTNVVVLDQESGDDAVTVSYAEIGIYLQGDIEVRLRGWKTFTASCRTARSAWHWATDFRQIDMGELEVRLPEQYGEHSSREPTAPSTVDEL
jgi:hypothetical protein